MSVLGISNAALWVVVIIQCLFILVLFRYIGLLLDRVPAQGLPIGQLAPQRQVADFEGNRHVLGGSSGRFHLLLFTSPTCPWCEQLEPDIAPFGAELGPNYWLLLVLAETNDEEVRAYARRVTDVGPSNLRVVTAPELYESYGVPGTPYGMLIDREGVVRSKGTANTLNDLRTLVVVTVQGKGA